MLCTQVEETAMFHFAVNVITSIWVALPLVFGTPQFPQPVYIHNLCLLIVYTHFPLQCGAYLSKKHSV